MQQYFPVSPDPQPKKDKEDKQEEHEKPPKPEITHIGSGGAFAESEGGIEEDADTGEENKETPY